MKFMLICCLQLREYSYRTFGMILDSKLNFINHLSETISKANKGIGIIRRLYKKFGQILTY